MHVQAVLSGLNKGFFVVFVVVFFKAYELKGIVLGRVGDKLVEKKRMHL